VITPVSFGRLRVVFAAKMTPQVSPTIHQNESVTSETLRESLTGDRFDRARSGQPLLSFQ
jgi:hypothetical protein